MDEISDAELVAHLRERLMPYKIPRTFERSKTPIRDDAGKVPGEVILQTGISWAEDEDAALEGARVWQATQPQEYFTDDWHDPQAMYENAEREVSDDDFKQSYIIGSDPELHVERLRQVEALGATVVCIQNASGSDPLRALQVYGEQVLPALKGARV